MLPTEAREAWFAEHAMDVDCVIFYLPPSDHQLGWDYPRLRDWLAERGKRSLLVRQDAAQDPGEITRRVSQWLSSHDQRRESRRRHEELTQLEVTRTLRAYQREWFARLRKDVFEQGRPYAIGGALVPHEIFEALDLPFITDVWYSGLVAALRQSAYYSNFLTSQGFHEGLSRYGALALAVLLDEDNPDKPWGGVSKPALVITAPATAPRTSSRASRAPSACRSSSP